MIAVNMAISCSNKNACVSDVDTVEGCFRLYYIVILCMHLLCIYIYIDVILCMFHITNIYHLIITSASYMYIGF